MTSFNSFISDLEKKFPEETRTDALSFAADVFVGLIFTVFLYSYFIAQGAINPDSTYIHVVFLTFIFGVIASLTIWIRQYLDLAVMVYFTIATICVSFLVLRFGIVASFQTLFLLIAMVPMMYLRRRMKFALFIYSALSIVFYSLIFGKFEPTTIADANMMVEINRLVSTISLPMAIILMYKFSYTINIKSNKEKKAKILVLNQLEETQRLNKQLVEAQQELHQQKQFLNKILDMNPSLIFSRNQQGEITLVNKAATEAFGLTVGQSINDFSASFLALERRLEEPNLLPHDPFELRLSNDEKRIMQASKVPIYSESGTLDEHLNVITDITSSLAKSEAQLKKERKFRLLFENGAIGWLEINLAPLNEQVQQLYNSGLSISEIANREDIKEFFLNPAYYMMLNQRLLEIAEVNSSHEFIENFELMMGENLMLFIESEVETLIEKRPNFQIEIKINTYKKQAKYLYITTYYPQDGDFSGVIYSVLDITAQKSFEKQLQAQLNFVNSLIETIPNPIFYKNTEGVYTGCNSSFSEYLGISADLIIGKTDYDISLKHLADQYHEADLKLMAQKGKQVSETQLKYADETLHDVIIYKSAFQDGKGKPLGLIGSILDISERKTMENELRKREEHFRMLFEGSPLGIALEIGKGGTFNSVNLKVCEMLGYSAEELEKLTFMDITHPNDRALHAEDFKKLWNNEIKEFSLEKRYLRKDNSILWAHVNVSNVYDRNGGLISHVAMISDITEKKKAMEELAKNEAFLKAYLETLPDLKFLMDKDGTYLKYFPSANADQDLAVPYHQFIGKRMEEIIPIDIAKPSTERIKLAIESKTVQTIEYTLNLPHGIEYFEARMNAIDDQVAVVVVRNISKIKQAQAELEASNDALRKANEELDRFVYSASHDLRAPITSVLGLVELSKNEEVSTSVKLYLDLMEESLHKLDNFIKDIVHYSRNSRLGPQLKEVNLKELIEDSLRHHSFMTNADKIQQIIDIKGSSSCRTDESRLRIVVNNLVSNAFRYADLRKSPSYLKIVIHITSSEIRLVFEDNGIGIPQTHQDKIFEMFHRANDNSKGSGLGLFITKECIEKLEGKISVKSVERKGTTFSILLPNH